MATDPRWALHAAASTEASWVASSTQLGDRHADRAFCSIPT